MFVTRDMVSEKIKELCEMIESMDEGQGDAACFACNQVVCAAAESHFDGVGILTETMLQWREFSVEVLNEDHICDDCKDKAKTDIEKNLKDIE